MKKFFIKALLVVVVLAAYPVITWFPNTTTVVYTGEDAGKDRFNYIELSADGTCGDRDKADQFEIKDAWALGLFDSGTIRSGISNHEGEVLDLTMTGWRFALMSYFEYPISYEATGDTVPFC